MRGLLRGVEGLNWSWGERTGGRLVVVVTRGVCCEILWSGGNTLLPRKEGWFCLLPKSNCMSCVYIDVND